MSITCCKTEVNCFGTDGIRDRVGQGALSKGMLISLGNAIGLWGLEKYGSSPRILIINDTRISCEWVKSALKTGMLAYPLLISDGTTLPTPAAMHLLKDQFDCAVIISASHNPWYDNGIKILDRTTGKLREEDELELSNIMTNCGHDGIMNFGSYTLRPDLIDQYVQKIVSLFQPQLLTGIKIVLDVSHGATYLVAPMIMGALGAEVFTINDKPNGFNINEQCGSLHPQMLQEAVHKHSAHVGFAFDGDGDRVIVVNNKGAIKDGDEILALLSNHSAYSSQKVLVGTSMTNEGLVTFLKSSGKSLIRTPVGDKYILKRMVNDGLLLGGESSGHIILNDLIQTADGILTAIRVLEAMMQGNNHELITFEKYPQVVMNIPVRAKPDLTQPRYANIISSMQERLINKGRLLVRYSGTEPLLRIMVEAQSQALAMEIAETLRQQLEKVLSVA